MRGYDVIDGERTEDSVSSWLRKYDPRTNLTEFLILMSTVLLAAGLSLVIVGYIVPRGYKFNQNLPARQMEAIEIYYARLSFSLDLCIVVGMGLVGLAAVIVTTIVTYGFLTDDTTSAEKEEYDLDRLNNAGPRMTSYGSHNSR